MLGSVVKFLKSWETIKDSINQMTRETRWDGEDVVEDYTAENADVNHDIQNGKFFCRLNLNIKFLIY